MQPASLLVYIIIMKLKKIKLVVIAINLLQTTILSICQVFFLGAFHEKLSSDINSLAKCKFYWQKYV